MPTTPKVLPAREVSCRDNPARLKMKSSAAMM